MLAPLARTAHQAHSTRNASRRLIALSSSPVLPSTSPLPDHQYHQRRTATSSPRNPPPPETRTIFSGIQPTGVPHLGNYLGALREWVRLQNEAEDSTKLIFSIVDLHALTVPQDPEVLKGWRKEMLAALLAVGIKKEKSVVFFQSQVSAHSELMWILSTVSSVGYLSRMTQWKSKLGLPVESTLDDSKARKQLKLGLFSYPVLQAADILVHGTTDVPVGEDQRQHLEFTREVANGFNHIYGPVLNIPASLISPAKRVMALRQPTLKMSKSDPNPRSRILLTDTPAEIHKKIKDAVTDNEVGISYDPAKRPGMSNLVELLGHMHQGDGQAQGSIDFAQLAAEHQSLSPRAFKELVSDAIVGRLAEVRERYLELMDDKSGYLDSVAEEGAVAARKNADTTLVKVKAAMGLL